MRLFPPSKGQFLLWLVIYLWMGTQHDRPEREKIGKERGRRKTCPKAENNLWIRPTAYFPISVPGSFQTGLSQRLSFSSEKKKELKRRGKICEVTPSFFMPLYTRMYAAEIDRETFWCGERCDGIPIILTHIRDPFPSQHPGLVRYNGASFEKTFLCPKNTSLPIATRIRGILLPLFKEKPTKNRAIAG